LTALQLLNLSGCSKLKELPTSIDKLTALSIVGFVKVLGVDGVTCIYWQIEYLWTFGFVRAFAIEGVTYIYW
jgi:hypothetical protein